MELSKLAIQRAEALNLIDNVDEKRIFNARLNCGYLKNPNGQDYTISEKIKIEKEIREISKLSNY